MERIHTSPFLFQSTTNSFLLTNFLLHLHQPLTAYAVATDHDLDSTAEMVTLKKPSVKMLKTKFLILKRRNSCKYKKSYLSNLNLEDNLHHKTVLSVHPSLPMHYAICLILDHKTWKNKSSKFKAIANSNLLFIMINLHNFTQPDIDVLELHCASK